MVLEIDVLLPRSKELGESRDRRQPSRHVRDRPLMPERAAAEVILALRAGFRFVGIAVWCALCVREIAVSRRAIIRGRLRNIGAMPAVRRRERASVAALTIEFNALATAFRHHGVAMIAFDREGGVRVASARARVLLERYVNRTRASATAADSCSAAVSASSKRQAQELSNRQAQVLSWVAEGKTNCEVAIILGISPRTVQTHLEHICRKLDVSTRTAAVAAAISARGDYPPNGG